MAKRLIDANKLREDWLLYGANENIYCTNDVLDSIDEAPTVDAVEVVRCEECKYREDCVKRIEFMGRNLALELNTYEYHPLKFCSYGERRCE